MKFTAGQLRVVTANVGGSREAIDWLCSLTVAVLLIKEHKLDRQQINSQAKRCLAKGWHGVWTQAAKPGEHHMPKSGGLAVLVPKHILITQGSEQHTHRYLRVTVPWTRHYDVSYKDRENLNGGVLTRSKRC